MAESYYDNSGAMKMRESRVLKKLRAGKVATCVKLNLLDPRVAEIAAMSLPFRFFHSASNS